MPDIMKQVGPQQYEALKELMGDFAKGLGADVKAVTDDEDDVPPLVKGTFEDASKKWYENICIIALMSLAKSKTRRLIFHSVIFSLLFLVAIS